MTNEDTHLGQVQRGIDFIERNLEVDLDLPEVSKAARMSHWHFQRIFRALTGETLKTYVRSRRMANAMDRLLRSRTRILDIALEAGFETQESFTRAFKQTFQMTPGAFRKLGDRSLFLDDNTCRYVRVPSSKRMMVTSMCSRHRRMLLPDAITSCDTPPHGRGSARDICANAGRAARAHGAPMGQARRARQSAR